MYTVPMSHSNNEQAIFTTGLYKKFSADVVEELGVTHEDGCMAGYCLSLPGNTLYLTPLLAMKKFLKRGNKDGAIRAFYRLEEEGLGKVMEVGGSKGSLGVS